MPIPSLLFELGSRDLVDAQRLARAFPQTTIYSFECNPEAVRRCQCNYKLLTPEEQRRIHLVPKAVALADSVSTFHAIESKDYENIGAASMFPIDFNQCDEDNPDYRRPSPQQKIEVEGIRLDTFCRKISAFPEVLCMDLQGYELHALKSLGNVLEHHPQAILTETCLRSSYESSQGLSPSTFWDLYDFLTPYGFQYEGSDAYQFLLPPRPRPTARRADFNCLFVRSPT